MPEYRVVWEIDVTAESPAAAARECWERYFRDDHTASVFDVFEEDGEAAVLGLHFIEQFECLHVGENAKEIAGELAEKLWGAGATLRAEEL